MLLVRTVIKPSRIHGIGVFADQFIRAGSVIWAYRPGLDLAIEPRRLQSLPKPAQFYLLHFAYLSSSTHRYVLCFDNARFFNHSDTPNTRNAVTMFHSESIDVASRNIYPGEELTTDYSEFDTDVEQKLGASHPAVANPLTARS